MNISGNPVKRVPIKGDTPPVFTTDTPQIIANLFVSLKQLMLCVGMDWIAILRKTSLSRTSKHSFTSLDSTTDPFRDDQRSH
jgi:hypothetical protein